MKTPPFFSVFLISLSIFFQNKSLAQTIATDSIAVQWEHLDGAPSQVQQFAQSGNKLFAATAEGLFQSTDGGQNWRVNQNLGRRFLVKIFANDSVILAFEERRFLINSYFIENVKALWVHRSDNKGLTWSVVAIIPSVSFQDNFEVSNIQEQAPGHCSFRVVQSYNTAEHWYSQDFGKHWEHLEISSVKILTVNANNGLFSGTWRSNTDNIINGYVCSKPDFSDFQNIPFPPLNAPIVAAINRAGTFNLFLRNNTLYTSNDAGQNWQLKSLAVEDSILDVEAKGADFYLKTNKGIWKGQLWMPTGLTKIYSGEANINVPANAFAALPSGYWVNTASNESIFQANGSSIWQSRSKGLSTKIYSIESICGRLYCATSTIGTQYPTNYFQSNHEDGEWELVPDSTLWNSCNQSPCFKYLGIANGYDYAYISPYISRSNDCGNTWDTLTNLIVEAAIRGMTVQGNRLFFYSPSAPTIYITDDNGDSWITLSIPIFASVEKVIAFQDTILAFDVGGTTLYRTIDFGQNWETISLNNVPSTTKHSYWQNGNKLITLRHFILPSVNNATSSIFVSEDKGSTWTQTFSTKQNYGGPYNNIKVLSSFPFYKDGIVFLHSAYGLQVSSDEGKHWTRITKLPFKNRLTLENDANTPRDTFAEGAQSYYVDGEYLYAVSEVQGIWRTPFSLIRDQALVHGGEYGFLKGQIYRDLDYNCHYEQAAGDLPLSQKTVLVQPGNILVNTDGNGFFNLALSPGLYHVSTAIPDYHYMNCGIPFPIAAVVTSGTTTTIENPFLPSPGIKDACLLFTTPVQARPGFPISYTLQLSNVGSTFIENAEIVLTFDNQWLEPQSLSVPGQFIGNQTIIPVAALIPGAVFSVTLKFVVSPSTPLGTILNFVAECPLVEDVKPSNNIARSTQTVTGSFDPNDKMAQTIHPEPPGSPRLLDYLIRFQNTGTDTAFTVVVTDTLDPRFDLLSIRTVESSHIFDFSCSSNGLAKWTFRDILLPDSTTNEPESHGYVRFQIKTRPDVVPGHPILNDGDIFFDFNSPVRTNEFLSENPKWTIYDSSLVKLCAEDTWGGVVWSENGQFVDTSGNQWSDTIFISQVIVSPTWDIKIDTTVDKGTVLFGISLLKDTIFVFHNQTMEGCDSTTTWHITVLTSDSKDLPATSNKFTLYPNPSTHEVWLVSQNQDIKRNESLAIRIFDMTGHFVADLSPKIEPVQSKIKLDVQDFPSGVYFIEIQQFEGKTVQKLIKI